MKKKTIRIKDRVIGIIGIIVCLILGFNIKGASFQTKAFPMGLLVALFALSAALIFRKDNTEGHELAEVDRIAITILMLGAYVVLIPVVGFLVMTIVFCLAFMIVHKPAMNKIAMLVFGVGYPVLIYLLFHNLLSVRLPSGFLI